MEENKDLKYRLANLLSIKSIVTIILTATFAYLAITKEITSEQFVVLFTMVIGFYFGTQSEKNKER